MIRTTTLPRQLDPVMLAEMEQTLHRFECPEAPSSGSAADAALDRLMRWDPKAGREGIDALTVGMAADTLQRAMAWILVHKGKVVDHRVAAAFLGIDNAALYQLAISGQLKPINAGGHARWQAEDLQRFVESLPAPVA